MAAGIALLAGMLASPAAAIDLVKAQADFTESYKLEAAGNLIGAIKFTKAMLDREPNYYEAILRLGYLYNLAGGYADAEDAYRDAIKLRPNAIEPRLALMQVLAIKERWEDVIKEGAAAMKLDHDNYQILSRVAFAMYNKGDATGAQKHYKRLLELYPADLEMKIGLAFAYLKEGNKKEAGQLFDEILTVSPGNPRGLAGWNQVKEAKANK